MNAPSLRIGSDILGWQEFGAVAVLGPMTRAMPGGDGSLEFTLPGIEAGKRRNVLRKDAEVILDTADDQWGGLIVGDPMAGYYAAQPLVSVAASGLWSQAANRRDVAWVWCDSDPTQWFRVRQYFEDIAGEMVDYIDQGKFAIDTEGRLMIRADEDRVFNPGSYATLGYWLGRGLADSGNRIVGVDISCKSQLPTDWLSEVWSYLGSPWGAVDDPGSVEWADDTSRVDWMDRPIDLEAPSRGLLFSLGTFAAKGSPAVDPWFKVRTVVVRCRMDGVSGYTANIIPTMTSATAPSGVASSSGNYSETYAEWHAFDHLGTDLSHSWVAPSGAGTGSLQYQFPTARTITRYAITSMGNVDPCAPKTWTFEGSNDGTEWDVLDTQTNVTDWAALPNERKVFDIANAAAYAYGRLNITDGNNGGALSVGELEMMEAVSSSVDRAVTLDKAMCDLATLAGLATVTRSETLGAARDQLAIRPEFEKSVADGLRELAALHGVPVEHYFDRAAGAWRFTCNELPAAVDPTRNRHWIIDDKRGGEDTSGVVRDPEAAPEYLRVTYLSSGVASIPDGQPRSYCYPSEPTDFVANVGVNTDMADVKLTDAQAADVAARLHGQMSVAAFSGSAGLPQTAITVAGQELPSRLIRPGDRVNIMGREGATDLYVSETSYDWSTGQMSITLGWPFEIIAHARKR